MSLWRWVSWQRLFWVGATMSLLLVLAACENGTTDTTKEDPNERRQTVVTPEATPDHATRWRNVGPAAREEIKRADAVVDKYEDVFWRQPNVHGFGASFVKGEDGIYTGEVHIVIEVTEKVPDEDLTSEDRIPPVLEGIPVQIIESPAQEFGQ